MLRLVCAVLLTAAVCMAAVAYARPLISEQEARKILASRGIIENAGAMLDDGHTYVIDRMIVRVEGDWIVVRILPKRMR